MEKRQIFSIRKLKNGAASVLIGAAFLAVSVPEVSAAEVAAENQPPTTENIVMAESNEEEAADAAELVAAELAAGVDLAITEVEAALPESGEPESDRPEAAIEEIVEPEPVAALALVVDPAEPVVEDEAPIEAPIESAATEKAATILADNQVAEQTAETPPVAAKAAVYIPPINYAGPDGQIDPVQEVQSEVTTTETVAVAVTKIPPIPPMPELPPKSTFVFDSWERDLVKDPATTEPYLTGVSSVFEMTFAPYITEYVDDPTLATGIEMERQPGMFGMSEEIIVYYNWSDGSTVTEKLMTLNTFPALNQIIARGSKNVATVTVTERTIKETYPVYGATEYKPDYTLPVGQEIVDVTGTNGYASQTRQEIMIDGLLVATNYGGGDYQEAKNRLIRMGTQDAVAVTTGFGEHTVEDRIEIVYRDNPDLPAGVVLELYSGVQPGYFVRDFITYKDKIKVHTLPAIDVGPIHDSSPKIIEYNFGDVDIMTEATEIDVDFYDEYMPNYSLAFGEINLLQAGKPGKATIFEEVYYENGVEVRRIYVDRDTQIEMEAARYEFGVGNLLGNGLEVVNEDIAFATIINENNALAPGEVKLIQPGILGQYLVVKDMRFGQGDGSGGGDGSGAQLVQSYRNLVREPIAAIIEISSWADFFDQTYLLDYATEYRFNPELDAGDQNVITAGQDGQSAGYLISYLSPGGETVTLNETRIIVPPVTAVIEVGTNGATFETQAPHTEVIPFATLYDYRDDYFIGYAKLLQAGQNGVLTITHNVAYDENGVYLGEETTEVMTTPVINEIFLVGTMPRPDPAVVAATPPIVKSVKITRTEVLPFEEIIIEDPTLPMGTDIREVAGVNGLITLSEFVIYADGQEIGREAYSSAITKEPITQVRRIGVKPADQGTAQPVKEIVEVGTKPRGAVAPAGDQPPITPSEAAVDPAAEPDPLVTQLSTADQAETLPDTGMAGASLSTIGVLLTTIGGMLVAGKKRKK